MAKPNKRTSANNDFHAGIPEVCRIGSNPRASTAHMTSGTYLNVDAPAECAGLITSWNVCYHPASAPDSDGAAIRAVHSKNEGMKDIPTQYDSHTFSFHTIGMKEAFILL